MHAAAGVSWAEPERARTRSPVATRYAGARPGRLEGPRAPSRASSVRIDWAIRASVARPRSLPRRWERRGRGGGGVPGSGARRQASHTSPGAHPPPAAVHPSKPPPAPPPPLRPLAGAALGGSFRGLPAPPAAVRRQAAAGRAPLPIRWEVPANGRGGRVCLEAGPLSLGEGEGRRGLTEGRRRGYSFQTPPHPEPLVGRALPTARRRGAAEKESLAVGGGRPQEPRSGDWWPHIGRRRANAGHSKLEITAIEAHTAARGTRACRVGKVALSAAAPRRGRMRRAALIAARVDTPLAQLCRGPPHRRRTPTANQTCSGRRGRFLPPPIPPRSPRDAQRNRCPQPEELAARFFVPPPPTELRGACQRAMPWQCSGGGLCSRTPPQRSLLFPFLGGPRPPRAAPRRAAGRLAATATAVQVSGCRRWSARRPARGEHRADSGPWGGTGGIPPTATAVTAASA